MNGYLSRRVPRWLVVIGWPTGQFGGYWSTFVLLLVLVAVLRWAGVDSVAAVGWLSLVGALAADVQARLRRLPGFGGSDAGGATGAQVIV